MRMLPWCCLFLLGSLSAAAWAEPERVEVISLRYRTAAEVIPIIRPLIDKNGAVTGAQSQLIFRTSPANLRQIKAMLRRIDVAPRRLRVTVRQTAGRIGDETAVHVGGDVRLGGESPPPTARISGRRTASQRSDSRQIQVIDGYSAFIRTGWTLPPPAAHAHGVTTAQAASYREVLRGFYVTPRVNGAQVTVEVSPRFDDWNSATGEIQRQRMTTIVTGRVGRWIPLGAALQRARGGSRGTVYADRRAVAQRWRVMIKVDVLDGGNP